MDFDIKTPHTQLWFLPTPAGCSSQKSKKLTNKILNKEKQIKEYESQGESTEKLYEELDKLQEGIQIEQVTRFLAESLTDDSDKLEFNKYFCVLVINSQKPSK